MRQSEYEANQALAHRARAQSSNARGVAFAVPRRAPARRCSHAVQRKHVAPLRSLQRAPCNPRNGAANHDPVSNRTPPRRPRSARCWVLFALFMLALYFIDKETQARQSPQAARLTKALAQLDAEINRMHKGK